MEIIDTHIHCWNFSKAEYEWLKNDTSILHRSYDIEEIENERTASGITCGVLVQSANNFEDTDWMLEVAARNSWIGGVVGWLPLMNSNETEQVLLEKYKQNNYFKGVRHLIHDEADPKWLLQPAVIESLEILAASQLTYDVVGVLPAHIETVLEVANKIPELKMVFDHLNQPPIAAKEKFGVWGGLMKEASSHKNLFAKISGLGTTTKKQYWGAADIQPYIEFVIESFGADRCMCGGDWPVSLLAASYTNTWRTYKKVIGSVLDEAEQDKVYYSNAATFYRL